jgi:hypothetical protein
VWREWTVIEPEPSAPEVCGQTCPELKHALRARGDADPDDAWATAFREPTDALKCHQEARYPCRSLARGARDVVQPVIGSPAEERERDVEVLRLHPTQSWKGGRENLRSAKREVRR